MKHVHLCLLLLASCADAHSPDAAPNFAATAVAIEEPNVELFRVADILWPADGGGVLIRGAIERSPVAFYFDPYTHYVSFGNTIDVAFKSKDLLSEHSVLALRHVLERFGDVAALRTFARAVGSDTFNAAAVRLSWFGHEITDTLLTFKGTVKKGPFASSTDFRYLYVDTKAMTLYFAPTLLATVEEVKASAVQLDQRGVQDAVVAIHDVPDWEEWARDALAPNAVPADAPFPTAAALVEIRAHLAAALVNAGVRGARIIASNDVSPQKLELWGVEVDSADAQTYDKIAALRDGSGMFGGVRVSWIIVHEPAACPPVEPSPLDGLVITRVEDNVIEGTLDGAVQTFTFDPITNYVSSNGAPIDTRSVRTLSRLVETFAPSDIALGDLDLAVGSDSADANIAAFITLPTNLERTTAMITIPGTISVGPLASRAVQYLYFVPNNRGLYFAPAHYTTPTEVFANARRLNARQIDDALVSIYRVEALRPLVVDTLLQKTIPAGDYWPSLPEQADAFTSLQLATQSLVGDAASVRHLRGPGTPILRRTPSLQLTVPAGTTERASALLRTTCDGDRSFQGIHVAWTMTH